MSQTFKMPVIPPYILGSPNPMQNDPIAVATTDPRDSHMEFASLNPDPDTIAHEYFHVIHLHYGGCRRADCEEIAEHFAQWYTRTPRELFKCPDCGFLVPEADDYTMCFRCGKLFIESRSGEEDVERLFGSG